MHEADSALIQKLPVGIVRIDDDEAVRVEFEMALDQGQRALADRSEADHHDRAGNAPVPRPMGHGRQNSFKDKPGVFEGG